MRTSTYTCKAKRLTGIGIAIAAVFFHPYAMAQTTVDLGTAESFAVLAGPAVTSTSGGTINGDLGVSPGNSFTPGADPVTVNGSIHLADAVSLLAQDHLTTAYNDAANRPVDALIVGGQLATLTLLPGVYRDDGAPASLGLSVGGTLILDADGDPDAVWIFQSESSLIAEPGSRVVLANGAQSCNVYWQVGSSATLRTDVDFMGTIMALEAITLETRAVLEGRALARTAAVTLDNNTITAVICEQQADDEVGYTIEKTLIEANGALSIGDAISFEISITNTGTVDLVVVELSDTYDTSQLHYVDAIPPSDDNVNDGTINWATVGPLTAGSSAQVVVNFIVVGAGNYPFGTNSAAAVASTDANQVPHIAEQDTASYVIEHGFIGDTVWNDVNGNGIPDEDLAIYGINGVTVNLYEVVDGVTNFLASTVTATVDGLLGQYQFDGLSADGEYVVVVDQTTVPSAYPVNTTPLSVTTDMSDGGSDFTVDFGFMEGTPTSIGWNDSNKDADKDQVRGSPNSQEKRNSAGVSAPSKKPTDVPQARGNANPGKGDQNAAGRGASKKDQSSEPVTTVEMIGSVALESDGLHIITSDTFRNSGMDPASMNPAQLRVYVDGSEVAAYVTSEQSTWATWDSLVFYVEDGQQVSLGYDQAGEAPLRMPLRFVFLEDGDGDVLIARVPDDAASIHVALSLDHVRYLITGFQDTTIWLLDVTNAQRPSLLLGADTIQIDGESGLYFSETETENGTAYAVGEGAIVEIDSINP